MDPVRYERPHRPLVVPPQRHPHPPLAHGRGARACQAAGVPTRFLHDYRRRRPEHPDPRGQPGPRRVVASCACEAGPGHPRMHGGDEADKSHSLLRCPMAASARSGSFLCSHRCSVRLVELDRERVDIFETFPELDPRPPSASATTPVRKRRKMSDAAKKAASIRMKKSWARRKKAQQS